MRIGLFGYLNSGNIAVCVILAVILAVAGPFGTLMAGTFAVRLAYWFVVVFGGLLAGKAARDMAQRWAADTHPAITDLLNVALMTAFFSPLLWLVTNRLFWPADEGTPTLATLAGYVAFITAGICVFRRVVPGFESMGYNGPHTVPVEEARPRIYRRLPEEFCGPILRLTVRDHFVDVIAKDATATIRLRFGDAIDEMEPVVGHATHRSHWVVRDAVEGAEIQEARVQLRMTNGDLVPVSRKYRPELEKAGLL